ncbi:hypothetical protein N656DRAFT_848014 [Canariomyces notabilis]|uniref:Uncharacterized protein n=1 Tax=Canariomyces notabilis TaxID=2074819 RepID=A0AAN6QL90_9PEZI|nr:hypothetical protein N656DRAFT_848014 [Canariomyces arenarius]
MTRMALQVPVHHHASARDSPQPIAEDKNLTIFDLPISIRNQIYDLVFYGIDRQKLLNEKEMLWTEKSTLYIAVAVAVARALSVAVSRAVTAL